LGHNDLTGAIPNAFTGLTIIGVLDLSHNHLNGLIPAGLGCLHFLAGFDVSNIREAHYIFSCRHPEDRVPHI
jgi:hypothetical protein